MLENSVHFILKDWGFKNRDLSSLSPCVAAGSVTRPGRGLSTNSSVVYSLVLFA